MDAPKSLFQALKPTTIKRALAYLLTIGLAFGNRIISAISNVDFIAAARENPRMSAVWEFLMSPTGYWLTLLLAAGWLTFFVWRQSKAVQRSNEPEISDKAWHET